MMPLTALTWRKDFTMTPRLITCVLVATTALAQAQAPQKQAPAPAAPAATQSRPAAPPTLQRPQEKPPEVAPDQPVISIRGLCPADTGVATQSAVPSTKQCVTTMTRQQFDNLVKALNTSNQPVSLAMRRKLAESYVEILIYSEAARAAGVESSPTYAEVMRFLRLRTLNDLYRNQLAEQFRNPSQQEIEAYYQANQSRFEGAKLSRIYLPKNSPDPQATAEQKQAFQKKVQQLLDEVQASAAKGEAIDKLQKEAYVTLGISAAPPSTEMNMARHGMFPAKLDQEIFAHQAGEVFRVDDANGYLIYHVDSRQTVPLDSVKEEISREIFRQKMEDKTKELNAPVQATYDEGYFGPPVPPGPPAGRPAPSTPR
jgi:PPIC-type PPIASE domain